MIVHVDFLTPKLSSRTLMWLLVIVALVVLLIVVCFVCKPSTPELYSEDVDAGEKALSLLEGGEPPEISAEDLARSQILLAKVPEKEAYSLDVVNTNYWPHRFYSLPYHKKYAGSWPPGMYSRLHYWMPGFYTSGWSYYLRPGIGYLSWPQTRWVRHQGSYYYITN